MITSSAVRHASDYQRSCASRLVFTFKPKSSAGDSNHLRSSPFFHQYLERSHAVEVALDLTAQPSGDAVAQNRDSVSMNALSGVLKAGNCVTRSVAMGSAMYVAIWAKNGESKSSRLGVRLATRLRISLRSV